MSSNPHYREDLRLKERCLDRDPAAWDLLFKDHFPGLVCYARVLLLAGPVPGLTPEDVAANVLGSLWENDCHLIHYYKPTVVCWQGFLRLLAKQHIGAARRRAREEPLPDGDLIDRGADGGLVAAQFQELTAALAPTLKQWVEGDVLGATAPAAPPCSPAAERKRLERLRRTFDKYLGPG